VANTTNRSPLIQVKELKKYFPLKKNTFLDRKQIYVRAVEDVNITLFEGETFGLVGESGCGKSTLGRIILQLYEPTSGSVAYYGSIFKTMTLDYIVKEIKMLSEYQEKAKKSYYQGTMIDEQAANCQKEMDSILTACSGLEKGCKEEKIGQKNYERLSKRLARLQTKALAKKKQSSRYLRQGSRMIGSLILSSKLNEIVELLLKAVGKVKHNRDIILALGDSYPEYFTEDLVDLFDKIKSYRDKDYLPIIAPALSENFQASLDYYRESGIMLQLLDKEEMRQLRRKLQIIFQDPYSSLDTRMTVGQIIGEAVVEHGLYKKGSKELEDYVIETMAKCGLDHYMLHRFPHQFSGGQRQRIGIARALALKPEFVVCDEAVSALDVSIQSQIINLLMELKAQEKLTYLFISHDLSVIKHISDRIGVMYLGVMVELGQSEEIYDNPLHPYTKALMSAIPTTDEIQPERILLKGEIPSNIFPPSGCKFRTRCPLARERCAKEVPVYREIKPGHFVACHFYEETKDMK